MEGDLVDGGLDKSRSRSARRDGDGRRNSGSPLHWYLCSHVFFEFALKCSGPWQLGSDIPSQVLERAKAAVVGGGQAKTGDSSPRRIKQLPCNIGAVRMRNARVIHCLVHGQRHSHKRKKKHYGPEDVIPTNARSVKADNTFVSRYHDHARVR
jgi:hypothetical protein